MIKRKPGYYRVRINDRWEYVYWNVGPVGEVDGCWWNRMGTKELFFDSNFEKIDENIIQDPNENTDLYGYPGDYKKNNISRGISLLNEIELICIFDVEN